MNRKRLSVYFCLLPAIIFIMMLLPGCDDLFDDSEEDHIQTTGTVVLVPVEGGCWAIDTDTSVRLQPMELPATYTIDGLRVGVVYSVMTGYASFCMIGEIVMIHDIWPL